MQEHTHGKTLDLMGDTLDLTGTHWISREHIGCHGNTLDLTGTNWISREHTGSHGDELDLTGMHWISRECTGSHRNTLDLMGTHWLLRRTHWTSWRTHFISRECTGSHRNTLDLMGNTLDLGPPETQYQFTINKDAERCRNLSQNPSHMLSIYQDNN